MLATFSSYFNRIKRQFFRTVENARSPCKRSLEDISEDEDDTQIQSYKPLRKKTCTTRDEMLPPITRSYQMKPILHWKPQPSPPLSTIKEDEPDVRDVRPDRKFFKTLRSPEVKESTSRQPPITTLFPVKPLSQVSTSSKIAPLKLSNRTIAPNKNNTSLGAWPRNCLKGCNYSVKNKKPLSTYTKRKPITISESFRIEEKQQYRQLLQHCTLSQSSSSLSSSQNVCQISPSSSSSSSPAMRYVRWSGNSSIESVPIDAGSESASPVFLGSNMSSRPSGKSKANRKEESENHQRPAIHQKSTRPKGPLPDMWQGLGNSRVKVKDKIESVIRSGSLHADDEELSLGQLVRQRHHEKMAKNTIPVIDLCQSDSDSIESVKVLTDSESDSVEIVDEFPHNRRKTDVLQDLYDGKWMEVKHVEFNSIDQKAKSTDVEDREVLSEKNNQVNHLHEKVQKRLKQLDIIHTLPEKHTPAKAASQEQTFTPLTPEMQDEIEAALNPYPKSEVLIHKFNIKITRQDIATLNSLNWLNDEVVNFYMNLIMDRSMRNKRLPKVYVFSTFFYPKLFQSGHKSVSRWTKKVDIFSYDILLIPIHLDVHWCMATVDFKKRSINYYDSMLGDNPKCLKLLLEYLKDEHLDKKKTSYPTVAWKLECTKNIPEQMNGSDCGMFSCKFAEFKSRQAPMLFTQEDMPYFRQRMVYEIIKGELLEG